MFDHFRLLFFGRNKIADGIEDIASDDDGFAPFASDALYDLQGCRVGMAADNSLLFIYHSSLKKGIYIVKGKKVVKNR